MAEKTLQIRSTRYCLEQRAEDTELGIFKGYVVTRAPLIHTTLHSNAAATGTPKGKKVKKGKVKALGNHDFQSMPIGSVQELKEADSEFRSVIHGHTNSNYVESGINQLWIDTLLQSGRLTVISAEQAFERLSRPF